MKGTCNICDWFVDNKPNQFSLQLNIKSKNIMKLKKIIWKMK